MQYQNEQERPRLKECRKVISIKETDGKQLKHNVSFIDMTLLCKAKKYDAALKVFEENLE